MDISVLGPMEAAAGGRPLSLGGGKPRALLAMLALQAGSPVSTDHLIEGLWGESPPATANKMIQIFVSQVRKALDAGGDAGRLVTRGRGYELRIDADDVDALRFERLLAAQAPREALALWRGPPLEELSGEPFAAAEIRRLEELRLAALEQAIEQDLAAGRHRDVIGELDALVAQEPLNERFHGQRMLALYRSGRQSDALAAYRQARETLIDQVGLEPGPELQKLNDAMLQHDPSLDAPAAAAAAPAAQPTPAAVNERRKVTVLHAGVTIDPELDPEALHRELARFSDRFASIVERHGGTVERSSAESAVGFFGLATTHEDDVLRALRAALELEATAGIDTGELFVGEDFASGQPLSRARRLFEAAPQGAILLSPDVHRLVEPVAVAEPADEAWQLIDLRPEESEPAHAAPFVGRAFELDALRSAFDEARTEPGCRMVTVVGPAGIGKSRLTRELVTSIGNDATIVVGRCVSYGVGITYGPVAEIVRQLGGPPRVAELLAGDPQAAQRVLGAIGESDEPGQAEEIFWGFRRLLEEAAREQPLVVAVEDVHWAEPTLLDLIEYLAAFSRELPILLVCLARPELLETRPAWTAPQAGRSVHVLSPLDADEAQQLAHALGANGQTAQVVETAEGNPLFLEQ